MIRNGLYSVTSKVLDGIEGNSVGVSVVQDGTMRGGGSIYYHVGSYTCSNGKWKGELTVREHEPALSLSCLHERSSPSGLRERITMMEPNSKQRLSSESGALA